MSLFGDLLSFGGSYLADNAQVAQQNQQAQQQQNQFNYEKGVVDSGQVDAFGNILNRRDPTTGAFTTTLSGPTQTLANTALNNTVGAEQRRSGFGDIAGDLQNQFKGTQVQGPLSYDKAMSMVNADNQRTFNSVIDPIANKIALQTQRTMGDNTNASKYASQATQQILPAIQIGGEQKAYGMTNDDMDRFIKQTLSLSEGLNNASAGQNIAIPGVESTGQIANALNAISLPTTQPVNGSAAAFNALSNAGNIINTREAEANQQATNQQLMQILQRQVGNAGSGVS